MKLLRSAIAVLSLPLMAFTCVNIQHVSVLAEPRARQSLEVLSSEYASVARLVEEWALKKGARSVDCGNFNSRRSGSPGCRGFELNYLRISVLFVPAESRTEIELFEFGTGQSSDTKTAELELKSLLQSQFGVARVKEGRSWQ